MKIKDNPRVTAAEDALELAIAEMARAREAVEKERLGAAIEKRNASRKRAQVIAAYVKAGHTMAATGREFGITGTRIKAIIAEVERDLLPTEE